MASSRLERKIALNLNSLTERANRQVLKYNREHKAELARREAAFKVRLKKLSAENKNKEELLKKASNRVSLKISEASCAYKDFDSMLKTHKTTSDNNKVLKRENEAWKTERAAYIVELDTLRVTVSRLKAQLQGAKTALASR